MAKEQRLILLKLNAPGSPADITPELEKLGFPSKDWTIQSVSVAAYGEKSAQAMVAVVLTRDAQVRASAADQRVAGGVT